MIRVHSAAGASSDYAITRLSMQPVNKIDECEPAVHVEMWYQAMKSALLWQVNISDQPSSGLAGSIGVLPALSSTFLNMNP